MNNSIFFFYRMDSNQSVGLSLTRVQFDSRVTSKFVGILSTHCIILLLVCEVDYIPISQVVMETNTMEIYEIVKINPSWELLR